MNPQAPYRECLQCDGLGIIIGPYDPNTGTKEIHECGKCDGFGIKMNRRSPEYKALRSALKINL